MEKEEPVMYKRILSLAVSAALALSLCAVAAAAEPELPKLGTPVDLAWGRKYGTSEDGPGFMSWKVDGEHQGQFEVCIYNAENPDEPVYQEGHSYDGDNWKVFYSNEFVVESNHYKSGTYYFTIQAKGDGVNYADGEVARSEDWEYVKPTARLATPAVPTWTQLNGCPAVDYEGLRDTNCDMLYVKVYFSQTPDEAVDLEKDVYWNRSGGRGGGAFTIGNWVLSEYGPGYYRARSCAVSADITKYQNSEWSELGEPYNFKGLYDLVKDQLSAIAEDATPQEIRQAVKYIGSLSTALLTDQGEEDGVAAKLAALEERTGVTKLVEVDETLGDTFATEQVSFVGAALNDLVPDATQVKLSVAPLAQETELVIPTLYKDTVTTKFSMDVEGIADTSDLAVPVRITMPVPENINPAFLVILHYDSQGVPQALSGPALYTYQENERWMVSFLVEHFSDFAFTETRAQDPSLVYSGTLLGSGRSLGWACTEAGELSLYGEPAAGETVLAAQYDGAGRLLDTKLLTSGRLSARLDAAAVKVSLFWLDAGRQPVSAAGTVWEKK